MAIAASADWSNLTVAGAFLLGFAVATLVVIRIVRAVASLFDEGPHSKRPPWRRRDKE